MLTFAYPWLFALLPLPLVMRRLLPAYRDPQPALRVPFLDRLARLSGRTPAAGATERLATRGQRIAQFAAWACVVTALARPQWLEAAVSHTIPVRDLLLAVDLSGSMATKDFTDTSGKAVDRLTAVKQVLDDFLARRKGDRVGLIVFGNAAFVQAPFTEDLAVCRELLAETQVGMAGPKTALGDAIGLAVTVFDRTDVPERVLIALTDGNDTGSRVPPDRAAAVAKDKGVVIHTVAVGDPKAAGEDALDVTTLKAISATTGGLYSFAADRAALDAVYRKLDQLPSRPAETVSQRPRRDLFHWPLAAGLAVSFAAAAVLLVGGRRP